MRITASAGGSRLLLSLCLLVAIVLLPLGCASAPVQEMSDARQAIHAARIAGSEQHSPRQLKRAERLVEEASHEMYKGNYRRARRAALAGKRSAIAAREAALENGSDE